MSFITEKSKHFINDDDNGFIFTACWWGVSLAGVTAALWMGNGWTDVIRLMFLLSLRNSNGLWFDFSADSTSWLIAYVLTTFTTDKTVKAQDLHKPKLCKARIHLNNSLWETDLKICPEPGHNMVARSASCRTTGWAASGWTFLSPFPHSHFQSYKTLASAQPNRHLWDHREDHWCLLYRWHLLVPWSLLWRTGCGPQSRTMESHPESLTSWTF